MRFYKMNGAGNDFIILNNMDGSLDGLDHAHIASVLCRRRLSLGADGLMVVSPSEKADFRMTFYNSDGSVGEMCGNGARCICRYGYETGLSGEKQTVETGSGLVTGERLDRRSYRIVLTEPTCVDLSRPADALDAVYRCAYVELGDPGLPHAVVSLPGLADTDLDKLRVIGRTLRHHAVFPKGANVNFFDEVSPGELVVRTFERGVEDFTYACGTGCASTALVYALQNGKADRSVTLHNPGGDLLVDVSFRDDKPPVLHQTGPTNIVAVGEITDEELE